MQKVLLLVIAVIFLMYSRVESAPIQWSSTVGGNDHYYEVISIDGYSWMQSSSDAQATGGYLVTVTSSAEQSWIITTFGSSITNKFMGGYQADGSIEPGGGWQWVTGESWSYTNWGGSEPNNSYAVQGPEDYLQFWAAGNLGEWNDIYHTRPDTVDGYIIEWNFDPTAQTAIPEPLTLVLFGMGILKMMLMRKFF